MTKAPTNAVTETLRDIRPPVEIPNPWLWVLWILAALLVAGLIALCVFLLKRRKSQATLSVPTVPPHIRARQRLQDALALLAQPKPFCTEVSDTIRFYLEERFNFHAPERTTEEFLHELKGTNLLSPAQKESLGEFLKRCDLVKFARYEPAQPELRDLHASALRLVEETEPQPEPAAGAAQPAPVEARP
ncbi:MAG TPA: cytochrome c-type biogenesis protein CcmH [Verrucomicrobia bacterium]|nr:cytochrome c-type biogenesis protein CcmH [Verrucomicrobiota bacterium]HOP97555.1 hypothetical protein [Verrucomicrobiota bacterium]HPU55746.1 hypothetical protein [Verrucomicrobiota bacterium]